jgi:membrane protease YdiL (CAAX protease family)
VAQTFVLPALMVGLQVLLTSGNEILAIAPASLLPAAAFYLAVLTVMQPAFRTLGAEGAGLWILYSLPHSLESILLQKAKLWAMVGMAYTVVIVAIAFATVRYIPVQLLGSFPVQLLGSAAVVVLGVPIFSMIAVALGVFACDPLAQEVRRRIRATYVYLYLMLGSFYGYAIYANDIWQRIALMILTALVAVALWQKARDQFDYLLDPGASPPSRVSVSDGLIAALSFFVLQALVVVVQTTGGRAVSGQGIWIAFCLAGATTYGATRFIYWRAHTVGVPVIVGSDGPRALRWGLTGGIAASICGIAYLELVRWTGLFPALRANPVADPALPAWLAALAIGAAPVFEEFVFRGLIFGGLRRSLGLATSTLASAAIFAIVHPPAAVIPVFVMGACAALIYERTGALVGPMLVHALYNAAILGFQWNAIH